MGPVEYIVVEFPGNKFSGDIVPALKELTDNGTIHIIDLVFVHKDAGGNVRAIELGDLPVEEAAAFEDLDGDIDNLLNEEDIQWVAEKLQPNSSAAFLVFEDTWATRFQDAIINSGGRLVDSDRIPASVVQAAFDEAQLDA